MQNLGYTQPLFILAFDHRSSFSKNILGLSGEPNEEQTKKIQAMKQIIYNGFVQAINQGVPKESAAILTDEQFGMEVLKECLQMGNVFAVCTEKSGQKEFMFEHGEQFGQRLLEIKPTFAKALIRYNPEDDQELNQRQLSRLKQLSDFCHNNNMKLLIEPLVVATENQLKSVEGDQKRYDLELRPRLMVGMVRQMQEAGVEADVWKIEGLEKTEEYEAVIKQAKNNEARQNVVAVILGRGADDSQVEKWLTAASKAEGLKGFAIGRSIFHEALMDFKEGKILAEEASSRIAAKYLHFYKVYTNT